jgi:putative ABC transport system ATP-binding protein
MNNDIAIELKNIWKSMQFGNEQIDLLKDISMTIKKGEFVAIIGPSGSGKSTLLNIIGCLDKPTKGSYTLLGENIHALNEDRLAEIRQRMLGFIFQSFHLISDLTAFENIMVPHIYTDNYDESKGQSLLKAVNLADRADHRPNELSGGQKQRVAIARALMNDPEIILADEPTGNLDSTTGEQIFELLTDMHKKGKTIVMVTHDPDIAKRAERIITVKDGVLISV